MHPKSENVLKVIKNFKKIPRIFRTSLSLDMSNGNVRCSGSICGTPHCHGGWYVHAKHTRSEIKNERLISYATGMNEMGKDLGFTGCYELTSWAHHNPEIWGNGYGGGMFGGNGNAFKSISRPKGARNLQDIINHWQEVYERLKSLEKVSEYKDITKNLAKLPIDETVDSEVKPSIQQYVH